MKILYTIFYNYILWFEKLYISQYKIISSAFCFMALLLLIAVCAIGDTIMFSYNYTITDNLRMELILFVAIVIFGSLYFGLIYNGKAKRIIELKPKLFNSELLSALITLFFTILCFSTIILVSLTTMK